MNSPRRLILLLSQQTEHVKHIGITEISEKTEIQIYMRPRTRISCEEVEIDDRQRLNEGLKIRVGFLLTSYTDSVSVLRVNRNIESDD